MPVYHTAAGAVEMLEWGDGPELFVLLHAAAAGPQSLAALATMLLRPGRRIIAPALDRYGATMMHEGTDRMRAHVDVLRACLTTHTAARRVLFGHSMGGLVGLLGAIGGSSFDVMILYEPIVTACLRADQPSEVALRDWDRAIVAAVRRGITDGDPERGIATFITAWNETPWGELPLSVRSRLVAATAQLVADMKAVSYHDLPLDRLTRLAIPVLLLQGALSPLITRAMSDRLQSLLPKAPLITLDGCGHMGPVQHASAIYQAIISSHPDLA